MLSFLKKNKLLLLMTLIGTFVGFIGFLMSPPYSVVRIEYKYPKSIHQELPNTLQTDTFFVFKENFFIRNYRSSIGDTLGSLGLTCSEIKVQTRTELSENDLSSLKEQLFRNNEITFNPTKRIGNSYSSNMIYLGSVSGFFLGVLISLSFRIISPRKKPNTTFA